MNPELEIYFGLADQFQDRSDEGKSPIDKILYFDSDIGRSVDFDRVAVHHVVVPPHHRSSSPHAESHEEEFVFVLKGQPHLWLNGYIHDLKPGHAVGFPSGTGIAHTFINNTDEEVHLLVAGECTKIENMCAFPINPELKQDCPIWWEDSPIQQLGPHNGLPGPILESDRTNNQVPKCIVYCPDLEKGKPFHYPGDSEVFGEGVRLTNIIGLKKLGIWYETLPSGRRSSFPHAHTHEEEFIYVVSGQPTVWMDGWKKTLNPGEFAAFPSGTGLSHAILNETEQDIVYLCIGEAENFKEEKIIYPLNPLRNKECQRKGVLWENAPKGEWGEQSSVPKNQSRESLKFELCTTKDWEKAHEVFEATPSYFLNTEGCEPSEAVTKRNITEGPVDSSAKYFKEFLLVKRNGENVGVLDIHANHPEEGTCYIGLLLIKESLFGQGLGTKIYQLAEDYILRSFECKKIRLGISDDNDVTPYWEKMGFQANGRTYNWSGEDKTTHVREFEKELDTSP